MAAESKRPFAHLTLLELLIGVTLLAVAGVFLVRNMQQAKEREQRQQFAAALNEWHVAWDEEESIKVEQIIFALIKANPKLHDAKSGFGYTPLHLAAAHGNRDIAQWLLDHGADIHSKENDGMTPLHVAAANGHKEVAALLLEGDVDVNAKTKNGETPLDWAKRRGRQPLIELLLKHGAKE